MVSDTISELVQTTNQRQTSRMIFARDFRTDAIRFTLNKCPWIRDKLKYKCSKWERFALQMMTLLQSHQTDKVLEFWSK